VAGGLNPGLSELRKNPQAIYQRVEEIALSYALPNAYPVPDRKDRVSFI
jgi:hypothetical protein